MSGSGSQPSGCAGLTFWAGVVAAVTSASFLLVVALRFGGPELDLPFTHPRGPGNGGAAANPAAIATMIARGIPSISDRHFRTGKAHGEATGAVSLTLDLPTDKDKAYAQDGLVWMAFGGPGNPDAILISLDEPENSVAISNDSVTALGVGSQCQFTFTVVTETFVKGSVECDHADAYRGATKFGTTKINVDFEAGS